MKTPRRRSSSGGAKGRGSQRRSGRPPVRRGPKSGRPRRSQPSFRIVYEDADVLVVDKPPGMLSATPQGRREDSVLSLLRERFGDDVKRRRESGLWIIHRLDRDASGLLVFARSRQAFSWLKEDFRARRVRRQYHAVTEGAQREDEPARGGFQSFLKEGPAGRVECVEPDRTGDAAPAPGEDRAKLAVSFYEVLLTGQGRTLFLMRMESGRKHQLRVHLQDAGHPIVGDRLYGKPGENPLRRLGLHASLLAFRHPATGREVVFESPPPPEFWKICGAQPPEPPAEPVRGGFPTPGQTRIETSWERVADRYESTLEGERPDDHFQRVIHPGALRLLESVPSERVLDVACGEGAFCRSLAALDVECVGVDASPSLIQKARAKGPEGVRYEVADARELGAVAGERFDAVTCIMALMNIDPLRAVLEKVSEVLKPGGRFVAVVLHPAFRAPKQTSWGEDFRGRLRRQYRRVDGYLTPGQFEIVMNPGEVARGGRKETTWTFHRPLQQYIKDLAETGFVLDRLEEWPSLRTSEGGRQAAEFNRIRREIPMFLGFRARKIDAKREE